MQEKRVNDYWNGDSNRSLSDSWKGFTNSLHWKEKPPKGCMWSGERLTKIQTTARPDHVWPEVWTKIGKAAQNREKQELKSEKPKLDSARRLRGIYFIDPEDQDCKENSLHKKIGKNYGSRHAVQKESSDQQHESGCGGNCIPKGSKDHLWSYSGISRFHKTKSGTFSAYKTRRSHGKQRFYFDDPSHCGSQIYVHASSDENPGCESSSGQGMKEDWYNPSVANGENQEQNKKRLFSKHKETKRKSTLLHWWTCVTSEKHGLRTKVTDTKAESCSVVTLRKMTLEPAQCWLNRARLRPKWLPPKYWMLLQDYQVVTDKQLVQDLPTLNWYVFLGKHWRSRGTSWTTLKWTPIGKIAVGKTIRGSSIGTLMGKSTKFGRSVCSSKTRIIPIGKCGWYQNGWREAEDGSDVEEIDEKRGSWWTHIISRPCVFGMYSTWMQTEWNYYWGVQKKVWITYFCWSEELPGWEKPHAKTVAWSHDMRGKTCSKMRWEILRTDRQKSGAAA